MGKRITIPYNPRQWALENLHQKEERWIVLVCHRRAGKTVAVINHLLRDALINPDSRYAFIAPTYKQAKGIAWDILKQYTNVVEGRKINESELRVDFPNGSRIRLYGADNPDSLRGITLDGVAFDEYSQQPSNVFTEVVRPALADRQGYGIWIGTPKGKNSFYRLFKSAQENEKYHAFLLKASESGVLPKEELEDAREGMDPEEYEQEFECSFLAAIKGSYYSRHVAKARDEDRITRVNYDPLLPVHTFWDLGVSDPTVILFVQFLRDEIRIIDRYIATNEDLSHYVKELQKRDYVYGDHWLPWDAQAKDLTSNESPHDMLKRLGIRGRITPNIKVNHGIESVKMHFKKLYIDERLEQFIDNISQYRAEWDDKRGGFKPVPFHDFTSHDADALRYVCVVADRVNMKTGSAKKRRSQVAWMEDKEDWDIRKHSRSSARSRRSW